jgi:hypothetical protein
MALSDHVNMSLKRGVKILTCDPSKRLVEAETRNGEVISVNVYNYTSVFRWPIAGEKWMVREENGSWYLDGIYEPQGISGEAIQAQPGDAVISSSSGRVLKNQEGQLTPIGGANIGKFVHKEVNQREPKSYMLPISSEARLVTFVVRGNATGIV